MKASFIVEGEPKAKGRPRFRKNGFPYTPETTVIYENLVRIEYMNQCNARFEGALKMSVDAYLSIPKNASKKKRAEMDNGTIRPLKKPDSSNILKSIEDALNGVAYHDDAQIVETVVRRFYGDFPRVEVTIENL